MDRGTRRSRGGQRAARIATIAALGAATLVTGETAYAAPADPAATVSEPPAVPAPILPGELGRLVPVGPRTVFTGDWETGDFSQWDTCQSAETNGSCRKVGRGNRTMGIVGDARQGRSAAKFEVRQGDVPNFGGGERSEVQSNGAGASVKEGDERWYQWSMKFPENFQNPTGGWFIVMQWHSSKGSPPLAINVSNEGKVEVGGDGVKSAPKKTIGPVRRGAWVDYTLHVKFSKDEDTGFVEAWENDQRTVPRTSRATMVDDSNYLKQGIYRDTGPTTSVIQDGLRVTAP